MTLKNTLSPEQALRRAFWSIKLPSFFLMFGPWFVALGLIGLAERKPEFESAALTWSVILFLGGFVAGWLVWSIQVPRWRFWAYARVTDIGELKRLAVARQYLWPEGHFFERTEIASKALRAKILQLEEAERQIRNGN